MNTTRFSPWLFLRTALVAGAILMGVCPSWGQTTTVMDFGDAPLPYPTTLQFDGARHGIKLPVHLGKTVDVEKDGQPDALALGDDATLTGTVDDEDGVVFLDPLQPGRVVRVEVTTGSAGFLSAWIDFNRDGDWVDAGEQVFASRTMSAGTTVLTFIVPTLAVSGRTYARFRFSSSADAKVTGFLPDGEVEDYAVTLSALADYGDAPATYGTLVADNGRSHVPSSSFTLGKLIDGEADGQPGAMADGDDLIPSTQDDEDGVVFLQPVLPGKLSVVRVTTTMGTTDMGFLSAWIDFDGDGKFVTGFEQILTDVAVGAGTKDFEFVVPNVFKGGVTYARFRLSRQGKLGPLGPAPDGEVEDYRIDPPPVVMDFGDAPGKFPTLLSQDGARHVIVAGLGLGASVDAEPDGLPSVGADGDDLVPANSDDEDGVMFSGPLVPGTTATVQVTCRVPVGTQGARLDAWVDFNGNQTWVDTGEQIFASKLVFPGVNTLTFAVPASATSGSVVARFRLSSQGGLAPGGVALDGEVEDHLVEVGMPMDFGDAPGKYPTLIANNGARHFVFADFGLGLSTDAESDGLPMPQALGDDQDQLDDEDGVLFDTPLIAGSTVSVRVLARIGGTTVPGQAFLDAWVDFNGNESWADPEDQVFNSVPVHAGINALTFDVPANAVPGNTFARFRISRKGGLSPGGVASDGEVEDYMVSVGAALDFGDAPQPFPTLAAQDGARHMISPGLMLGRLIDAEPEGQPEADSLGDDQNPVRLDDEDGVEFVGLLLPGRTATVQVTATIPGGVVPGRALLDAWVDFNGDGTWSGSDEQIFASRVVSDGVNVLTFNVPEGTGPGVRFSRFRLSRRGGLQPTGLAQDGEVEDHEVRISKERDRCDLSCEGREFWLTFPGNYAPDPDNPAKVSLSVQGAPGAVVTVAIPGAGFVTNVVVPATANVEIPLPRVAELGDLNDATKPLGVHVQGSSDLLVAGFNHARYTTDSYRAIHVPALGTRYVVMAGPNLQTGAPPLNGTQFAIVGTEPETLVEITPSVTTEGHVAGVPYQIVLNRGDVYQLRNTHDAPADLSGTLIRSMAPIAVFGGHRCANVPTADVWFCDHLVEQLLPVNSWGSDFLLAPFAGRSHGDTVRIVSAMDGTGILVNGVLMTSLDRGKVFQFPLLVPTRIVTSHPVLVAQLANSSDKDGVVNADPFMMLVPGTRHYEPVQYLAVPSADFPTNYVQVVVPNAALGTVTLDGVAVPVASFQPIGATGFSYGQYRVAPGLHRVSASVGIMACVYGWAEYDSYGHPGCFHFGDVQPPTINQLTYGSEVSADQFPQTPGQAPTPSYVNATRAQDNCSRNLAAPVQDPPAGTLLPVGSHRVTVSYTDESGNVGEAVFVYTITDTSPIVIDCPPDLVVPCSTNGGAVVEFTVKAHSQFTPDIPVYTDPPSGSFFGSGTNVVTAFTALQGGGMARCTFLVIVDCERKTRVGVSPGGDEITLQWTESRGTLEVAPSPDGPWVPVISGVNSYRVRMFESQAFFRVRY